MVDFAKADFATSPTPLTFTVAPVVSGSNTVQLQLQPLPSFTITYTADGSGWEKFNAGLLQHVATTIIGVATPFIRSTLQTKAQAYLTDKASFTVPPIPIAFDGISLSLTASNLSISTADADHVLVTATVNVS
ncbi:hypothetical protein [Acidovorax sp. SUPP3334]|uniref:hypothetical protein n=1 Tax=Acidovorax sp. SUPP3334 TaxID=2920881 RepID=UPI0023DE37FA|nr:hypothetical protein [Acidovorax sp. SUPP3334]GKT25360.1 hypothetical protein AVHM3334_17690 [Acidovorax sp. SUPP3334]